ncbi:MAG: hypothetical protein Cons2KO_26090 [Congregibacter sp.]
MIVMKYSLSRLALLCSLACCALLLEPASTRASTLLLTADKNFWQVSETHLSVTDKLPGDADLAVVMDEGVPWKSHVDRSPVPVLEGKGKTIWGHFQLTNPRKTAVSIHAVIRYSFLERIDWYWQDGSGQIVHKLGGQRTPVGAGEGPSRFPMIEFVLQAGETRDVYFRVRSDTIVILPVRVYERARWLAEETFDLMVLGVVFGCLFTMLLLGGLFYGTFRHAAFLWFGGFCLNSIAYLAITTGIGKAYLWPASTLPFQQPLWLVMGLGLLVNVFFVSSFLDTRQKAPRYHKLLMTIAAVSFLVCLTAWLPPWLTGIVFVISTGLGPVAILGGAFVLWRRGVNGAGLIAISWIPNQIGLIWAYLRSFDVVPYFDGNHYTMPLTIMLNALAFMWALHRQSSQAEHEATHDQLTELPNRTLFDRRISKQTQRSGRSVGVMQIDLDGFKGINDNYGHSAGDFVLQAVADRLRKLCESSGDAFRTGGDEFIVLCHRRTRKEDVEALAARIVEEVSLPIEFNGDTLRVGASVGVAYPLEGRDNILNAIDEADAALYQAKARGKGQVAAAASFGDLAHNRRRGDNA